MALAVTSLLACEAQQPVVENQAAHIELGTDSVQEMLNLCASEPGAAHFQYRVSIQITLTFFEIRTHYNELHKAHDRVSSHFDFYDPNVEGDDLAKCRRLYRSTLVETAPKCEREASEYNLKLLVQNQNDMLSLGDPDEGVNTWATHLDIEQGLYCFLKKSATFCTVYPSGQKVAYDLLSVR